MQESDQKNPKKGNRRSFLKKFGTGALLGVSGGVVGNAVGSVMVAPKLLTIEDIQHLAKEAVVQKEIDQDSALTVEEAINLYKSEEKVLLKEQSAALDNTGANVGMVVGAAAGAAIAVADPKKGKSFLDTLTTPHDINNDNHMRRGFLGRNASRALTGAAVGAMFAGSSVNARQDEEQRQFDMVRGRIVKLREDGQRIDAGVIIDTYLELLGQDRKATNAYAAFGATGGAVAGTAIGAVVDRTLHTFISPDDKTTQR